MTERGWVGVSRIRPRLANALLVTLLDAGEYIAALPKKKEHAAPGGKVSVR